MNQNNNIGSVLRSQLPNPTIDLAAIVEKIVAGVSDTTTPLLNYDSKRRCLILNLQHGLRMLGDCSQLITIPPSQSSNKSIYVGGQIEKASELSLRKALDKLERHIINQFNTLLKTKKLVPNQFIVTNLQAELKTLGGRVGGYTDRLNITAKTRIQRIQFADPETMRSSGSPLARVISAIETVEIGNKLETLLAAIGRSMQLHTDSTDNEIKLILEDIRNNYKQGDTQLQLFLDLLNDNKLESARIRLAVTCDIMEAIQFIAQRDPDPNAQLTAEYIRRVITLYRNCLEIEGLVQELELDLERHYGPGSGTKFLLIDELRKYGIYLSLPVWCHWEIPLLETISATTTAIQRHIGYRFKVNGKDPEYRKSAYEVRLQRLRETLLPETPPANYTGLARSLIQLLVLAVVVPRDVSDKERNIDVMKKLHLACNFFNTEGRDAIKRTLNNLEGQDKSRVKVMQTIAKSVIKILKNNRPIIAQSIRQSRQYYLNILPGILNTERAFQGMKEPLVKPTDNQDQRAAFYNHVLVTPNVPLPGALFSIKTTVAIKENLLFADTIPLTQSACYRPTHSPTGIESELIQIIWQPATPLGTTHTDKWRCPNYNSIVIEYDSAMLGDNTSKLPINPIERTQLAIRRTAYSVLAYVTLKSICTQLDQLRPKRRTALIVSVLRLQFEDREHVEEGRIQGLYAIAHAVEHALGQHFRIRMQGLNINNPSDYQRKGTFNALLSVLPLHMEIASAPVLDNIGVLSLVWRPVTEHPELDQDADKDFVLIGRTYHAKAEKNEKYSGYRLVSSANLLALESGHDAFNNPSCIIETIEKLYRNGCKHIIYMSQRLGWNQWGLINTTQRYHITPEFFAVIETRFPDLHFYPLTHDVFPATRLFQRGQNQDAFEVLDYQSHLQVWGINFNPLHDRSLIPVYSLATLHVVSDLSDGESTRPQSGFATYFLLTDPTPERLEAESRKRLDLITADSPIGLSLIAVLRGIHYIESEVSNTKRGNVRPVLHPFSTLRPKNIAEAGEIVVHKRSKNSGQVILSLAAILARVTKVLNIAKTETVKT